MQKERKTKKKSIEELNALKEKVESVNKKLAELTEDELAEVSGGLVPAFHGGHVKVVPGAEIDYTKLSFPL